MLDQNHGHFTTTADNSPPARRILLPKRMDTRRAPEKPYFLTLILGGILPTMMVMVGDATFHAVDVITPIAKFNVMMRPSSLDNLAVSLTIMMSV